VIDRLAISNHPIVTTRTTAQYLEVINRDRRFPHAGAVAVFAHFRCGDVLRALTSGKGAIVTTGAISGDPFVVYRRWCPGGGAVTGITFGGAGQMIGGLALGHHPIVTAGTGTQYL